jgi:hypothetical protein
VKRFILNSTAWVAALAVIWIGIPTVEFATQIMRYYRPQDGGYAFDFPTMALARDWLHAPELDLVGQIATDRLWVVGLASIVCVTSTCLIAEVLCERRSRQLMLLMMIGFFVPPIVKTLAWSSVFHDFSGWEAAGMILYVAICYFALYYGPYCLQAEVSGRSSNLALAELVPRHRAVWLRFIWSLPSMLLGAICVYSLLIFAGDELRRFGTNTHTLGDLAASIDPGRDRALAFTMVVLCVTSVVCAAFGYKLIRRIGVRNYEQ